jgi:hypothetical protein
MYRLFCFEKTHKQRVLELSRTEDYVLVLKSIDKKNCNLTYTRAYKVNSLLIHLLIDFTNLSSLMMLLAPPNLSIHHNT